MTEIGFFACYWNKVKNKIKIESLAFVNTLAFVIRFDKSVMLLFGIWKL